MPLKSGLITPSEKRLAEVMAATNDQEYARNQAGYKTPSGATNALQRPGVQAEIARIQQERLFNELLPLAVDCHIHLLTGANVPAGARVQAVKLVYDKTLGGDAGGLNSKEPHEMSADELANALIKLKREAAERASPVIDVIPSTPGVFE